MKLKLILTETLVLLTIAGCQYVSVDYSGLASEAKQVIQDASIKLDDTYEEYLRRQNLINAHFDNLSLSDYSFGYSSPNLEFVCYFKSNCFEKLYFRGDYLSELPPELENLTVVQFDKLKSTDLNTKLLDEGEEEDNVSGKISTIKLIDVFSEKLIPVSENNFYTYTATFTKGNSLQELLLENQRENIIITIKKN